MTQEVTIDLWDVVRTPSLAFRLYALFTLITLGVALHHLIRSWIVARPFAEVPAQSRPRVIAILRGLGLGLKRWIVANCLAWSLVTTYGLRSALIHFSEQGVVGFRLLNVVLYDLAEPLVVSLWLMVILYGIRWHILYRAERLSLP